MIVFKLLIEFKKKIQKPFYHQKHLLKPEKVKKKTI